MSIKPLRCLKCVHFDVVKDRCKNGYCDFVYLSEKRRPRRRESDIARDLFGEIVDISEDII